MKKRETTQFETFVDGFLIALHQKIEIVNKKQIENVICRGGIFRRLYMFPKTTLSKEYVVLFKRYNGSVIPISEQIFDSELEIQKKKYNVKNLTINTTFKIIKFEFDRKTEWFRYDKNGKIYQIDRDYVAFLMLELDGLLNDYSTK